MLQHGQSTRLLPCTCSPTVPAQARISRVSCKAVRAAAAAPAAEDTLGFKTMRRGIKEAANESILTPRFYTTDFEQMEEMFSLERNPGEAATDPDNLSCCSVSTTGCWEAQLCIF